MKQKHLVVLNKYKSYGEDYDRSIPYDSKEFSLSNFGRHVTTRPTYRDTKSDIIENHAKILSRKSLSLLFPEIVIIGDSIAKGLTRNCYFDYVNSLNFGIGGDKTQHILWRIQNYVFPSPTSSSQKFLYIQCGTNNLIKNSPTEIVDGILSIAVMAKFKNPFFSILIGGLLPCIMNGISMVQKVQEVNSILVRKSRNLNLIFVRQDSSWYNQD